MLRTLVASAGLALALGACSTHTTNTADTAKPKPDDVPQEVTCCVATDDAGNTSHEVVPVDRCPEENRNPVDACNIGPGDAEPNN